MEKMPHAQPMPPLRMVSDSRERSRLKITTDVAAMLESPVGPARTSRSFSLTLGEWRSTTVGVRPGRAEGTMGPIEKISQRGDTRVWPYTAQHQAGSYAVRNPLNDFKLL
jgi:hypothetical protein